MKLEADTITILENFSMINSGIVVKKNKPLKTKAELGQVVAIADAQKFPEDFAIFDLQNFLSVVNTFKDPELEFEENYVTITDKESKSQVVYYYADESIIVTPKDRKEFPEDDFSFEITKDQYSKITKLSSTLKIEEFVVKSDGKKLQFGLVNEGNKYSNSYFVDAGKCDKKFQIYFLIENLKMLPGDYNIKVSEASEMLNGNRLVSFVNKSRDLTYFIAPEEKSDFGD